MNGWKLSSTLQLVLDRSKNNKYWKQLDINNYKFVGPSTQLESYKSIDLDNEIKTIDKEFIGNRDIRLTSNYRDYVLFGKGVGNLYK